MRAEDLRYGRRGGGWVDHDPASWRDDLDAIRAANGGELRPAGFPDDGQLTLFELS